MALLETLQDDFTGTTLNPRWTGGTGGSSSLSVSGTLNLNILNGAPTNEKAYVASTATYAFTDSYALARVYPDPTSPTSSPVTLKIRPLSGSNYVQMQLADGYIRHSAYNTSAATIFDTYVAYNSTTMAWWRIRHTGTIVYTETSADGLTWAVQAQGAYTPSAAYYLELSSARTAPAPRAISVSFDNVNLPPVPPSCAPTSINDAETVPAPTASLPLDRLQDAFTTGTLDTVKWSTTGIVGSTATVTAGTLNIDTAAGLTNPIGTVRSVAGYSFTGSGVFAKVVPDPTAAGQTTHLRVIPFAASNEVFYFIKTGTSLGAFGCDTTGTVFNSATTLYDPVAHAWWKIRHTAGTIYWETSPDGYTWTIRLQHVYAPQVEPYRARMYTQWTGTSTAGTVTFDNINIAPPYAAPTPATDVDTLGTPTTTTGATTTPNPIADTDTAGAPTAARIDAAPIPDSITDGETLGPPTVPGPRLIETLQDDFTGVTLDPAKWTSSTVGTAITPNVYGGNLNFDVTAKATAIHTATVTSTDTYLFANSSLTAQVTPTTASNTPTTGFRVKGADTPELFWFQKVGTGLTMRGFDSSGLQLTTATVTYNATNHAWWRIRHTAGVVYWETASVDVGPWAILRQVAYTPVGVAYNAVCDFAWSSTTTATTPTNNTRFDNVNNIPSGSVIDGETLGPPTTAPTALPMENLVDDFGNLTQWYTHGTVATPDVTGGTLNLVTTAGLTGPTTGGVTSVGVYDLTESYIYVKVVTTGSPNTQSVYLTVINLSNPKEFFQIYKLSTNIWFRAFDATGAVLTSGSIPYVAATHAWWRISHTSGAIRMETSPDSVNWALQGAVTGSTSPSVRAMQARLETGFSGTSSATTMRYDNVNTGTAPRPNPITDPETLGNPTAAVITGPPDATPDPINDPETLGDPEAVVAGDDSHIPDSIEDFEQFEGSEVVATDDTLPDPIADPEALGNPTAESTATAQPDPITDPETLGPATPIRNNNVVTPDNIGDPETFGDVDALIEPYPAYYPDSILDLGIVTRPDSLIFRELNNFNYGAGIYSHGPYSGTEPLPEPPPPDKIKNLTYGTGTYGYGIYYGSAPTPPPHAPEPIPMLADVADYGQPPLHILGIGPWSAKIVWRGLPNYGINLGQHPARPAIALPPATSKGFTLRLAEGSEARIDLSMRRGDAIVIDEMDTDLWWRRKDPRTKQLEVIGRFNCAHIEMATSDTGVSLSAQFEDYVTILGARMVLKYLHPEAIPPTSMWDEGTPVTDILKFALPTNTGLDLTEVSGATPYPLGNIVHPYDLPPGTLIADVMNNLEALSVNPWEWWIETPGDVNKAPKLRFTLGQRGADKGVTLLDAGAGPTPIAAWTRNSSSDDYANALYYTGSGSGVGADAGGGVVEVIPAQILQYGQRDAQFGSSSQGGLIKQIRAGAVKKLRKLADRTPTYTVTLAHGFWRGRSHIDVGDTITLLLRLGKEFITTKYRVSEIAVNIDDNGMEDVSLTLGTPRASSDPRSSQSPIMRMLRALKNYHNPDGSADIPPRDE